MTRDRRILLLLTLLIAFGLLAVEGKYRQHEDVPMVDGRHRHRHRHESNLAKRNHNEPGERRPSWSQDLEYEDDPLGESEDEEDEDEEEDYEARSYYERFYPRSSYHSRTFEPRHQSRYHRAGYRGWYDEDNDRRRGPSRYSRNHRFRTDRTHRRITYSRNHEAPDYDYGETDEDEFDYDRGHRYDTEQESSEKHRTWRKPGRKQRTGSRHQWKSRTSEVNNHRTGRRYHVDNTEAYKRFDDWRRRVNSTETKSAKHDKRNHEDDYDYHVDGFGEKHQDKEEDEIWREAESEDETEDEDEEDFDNDFSKSEKKPPLKTYDDIIRRLTSDDPTTPRSTVKRDYRNIEMGKHIKRDAFGNFKYESRNSTRAITPYMDYLNRKGMSESSLKMNGSPLKVIGSSGDHKFVKDNIDSVVKGNDRQEKKVSGKNEDSQAKTKSLEQDYDEYLNSPDSEKDEDLVKAGVEEDSGMQADVTNTDYGEEDNVDEEETPATTRSTSKPTTTTVSSVTTTTARNVVTQHYDYRDPRAYDGGTGSQYNGYQSKRDYPPMSAHSVHKWQSLGTRESVKETRSNMNSYNKNGKSAEIREALQHAIKVSREGSCQWPRPRVIPVRDVYPSPSTTYIPHCAILHRCSDDTGCCRSDALTCVPKHSHRVELSFYTTNVNGSSVVEKLSFYNDTECECREKTEYDTPSQKLAQRVSRHYQSSPQPQNIRRPTVRKPCRCPSEFTPRITPEGKCQCHCHENDQNCIKTRRGKGYFSLADRSCIQREECAVPICEFGEYIHQQGKCPRKKDRFDAIANFRTNLSHRYRS